MTNISYMRAGASCLPLIGPWVGAYNLWEGTQERSSIFLVDRLTRTQIGLISSQGGQSIFLGTANQAQDALQTLEARITELRNKYLPSVEKSRVYAICGIVGNVLSVALLVKLTALGILSGARPLIAGFTFKAMIASFTLNAIVLSCYLYQCNKIRKNLQTT